ncbi:MAG: ATP-binding protein [Bdellovibrionia bacterium]
MWRFANRNLVVPIIVKDYPLRAAISLSILLSAFTVWFSETLWSYSGEGNTHAMLPLAAVFISAIIGGFASGLLSTLITTLALAFLLDPSTSFYVTTSADRLWLGIYVVSSICASWLGALLKSLMQNFRRVSDRLEKEVQARTSELTMTNLELRRLVNEIEESRNFLDSLIENIPLPVYVKSADDWKIVRVNRAARNTFSQYPNLIGKTAFEFFPKETAQRITQEDMQAINSDSVVRHEETFELAGFGMKTFSIIKVPIRNHENKGTFILAIAEDITEKRRAEEQRINLLRAQVEREEAERKKWELEEAVRARDTFLSICSHELKTPLTSLKLQTGVIRMLFEKSDIEALRSPKVRELVMDADKEINRINRLINDMLDVSRIRSGKLTLRPGSVDLCDVVREVVSQFRANPAYHHIEIATQLPEEATGEWDRNRIEQIVINLVSNALKYGNGKPVRVLIQTNDKIAYLTVEDQGVGISPEDQKRIFQRFERAAATESISGLGLGLYIVKEIVTMHGGYIQVESEPGKGSRFKVELPRHFNYAARAA